MAAFGLHAHPRTVRPPVYGDVLDLGWTIGVLRERPLESLPSYGASTQTAAEPGSGLRA
jgi:hypothetical protein